MYTSVLHEMYFPVTDMGIKKNTVQVVNDVHCMGCKYYRLLNGGVQMYCGYIFVEDRKRPCDPGKDCTVRLKRKGKR